MTEKNSCDTRATNPGLLLPELRHAYFDSSIMEPAFGVYLFCSSCRKRASCRAPGPLCNLQTLEYLTLGLDSDTYSYP